VLLMGANRKLTGVMDLQTNAVDSAFFFIDFFFNSSWFLVLGSWFLVFIIC
jgi:hypothetical protein